MSINLKLLLSLFATLCLLACDPPRRQQPRPTQIIITPASLGQVAESGTLTLNELTTIELPEHTKEVEVNACINELPTTVSCGSSSIGEVQLLGGHEFGINMAVVEAKVKAELSFTHGVTFHADQARTLSAQDDNKTYYIISYKNSVVQGTARYQSGSRSFDIPFSVNAICEIHVQPGRLESCGENDYFVTESEGAEDVDNYAVDNPMPTQPRPLHVTEELPPPAPTKDGIIIHFTGCTLFYENNRRLSGNCADEIDGRGLEAIIIHTDIHNDSDDDLEVARLAQYIATENDTMRGRPNTIYDDLYLTANSHTQQIAYLPAEKLTANTPYVIRYAICLVHYNCERDDELLRGWEGIERNLFRFQIINR